MQKEIFGTDGVRGTANIYPMNSEMALQLGRAIAYIFRKDKKHHAIVVGKDTRISGYMLETALASGITSMGVDVMLVGPLPTPGIAFITQGMRADAGVVISASHNGYEDNGIKFFDTHGFKLPDELELEMERLILSKELDSIRPTGSQIGKAVRIDDAGGRYIEFLKNSFPKGMTLEGMKIVVDCANGAAYKIAPAVFRELGAKVIPVAVEPDGLNINRECGSLYPEYMCRAVKENGADLGIALDGDADRIIMCDEKGEVVDGDYILALSARHLFMKKRLAKNTVVATVMSNLGLDIAMQALDIKVVRTKVGDRYVVKEMRDNGYNFGGEQSGHIIFLDYNTTGDGVLAALQILSILRERGEPLSVAKRVITPLPQVLTNVVVKRKEEFSNIPSLNRIIEGVKRELAGRGRVLVRYSGTEMLARVMVEGEDPARIKVMADSIAGEIQKTLG